MKAILQILILLCAGRTVLAQTYAERLLTQLSEEYDLPAGAIATRNDELATLTGANTYGMDEDRTFVDSVEGQPFRYVHNLFTPDTTRQVFDHATIVEIVEPIAAGDRGVLSFWIRGLAADSLSPADLRAYVERNGPDFEKYGGGVFTQANIWKQIFIPFEIPADESFPAGGLGIPIQLGAQPQAVQLAGVVLVNYGQTVPFDSLPSNFQPTGYAGDEPDAPWRAAAADRIERNRKADLTLEVTDVSGAPLANRSVQVRMTRNAFGFGSAVVANRFPGGADPLPIYVDKLRDIDGNGNRFTEVVFENDLKWDLWENEALSTQEHTVDVIDFLIDSLDMDVRGHNLLWGCSNFLPQDVRERITDTAYVLERIRGHFDAILSNPGINGRLIDWDLINEIAPCEDLANAFAGQGEYVTGRELYPPLFELAKGLDSNANYYYNDYQVLQYGGRNPGGQAKFLDYAREIIDAGVPLEGIGLQGHMDFAVPPADVVELLDLVYDSLGLPIKITEFDLTGFTNPEFEGQYTRDFLTAVFADPNVEAFLTWGFWDGNHWRGNAPFFDIDWQLKPSGQAMFDLMFDEWSTDTTLVTDESGVLDLRGFKGDYEVSVASDGSDAPALGGTFTLAADTTVQLVVGVTPTEDLAGLSPKLVVAPNPTQEAAWSVRQVGAGIQVALHDLQGRQLWTGRSALNGTLEVPAVGLPNGIYVLRAGTQTARLVKQ